MHHSSHRWVPFLLNCGLLYPPHMSFWGKKAVQKAIRRLAIYQSLISLHRQSISGGKKCVTKLIEKHLPWLGVALQYLSCRLPTAVETLTRCGPPRSGEPLAGPIAPWGEADRPVGAKAGSAHKSWALSPGLEGAWRGGGAVAEGTDGGLEFVPSLL